MLFSNSSYARVKLNFDGEYKFDGLWQASEKLKVSFEIETLFRPVWIVFKSTLLN